MWLCREGVIPYNTTPPYPKITRICRPRTPAKELSIALNIANLLSTYA